MVKRFIAGFTIMEMAVAIVILGILASMALPYMGTALETMRSKEGVALLQSIYQAQLAANADIAEGRILTYSMGTLDITYTTAPDAFAPAVLDFDGSGVPPPVIIGGVSYGVYAHTARLTTAYTLYIQGDTGLNAVAGRILCDPQSSCQPMRYAPW